MTVDATTLQEISQQAEAPIHARWTRAEGWTLACGPYETNAYRLETATIMLFNLTMRGDQP